MNATGRERERGGGDVTVPREKSEFRERNIQTQKDSQAALFQVTEQQAHSIT